ncbi:MAG: hypothetical protein IJZ76_07810 [Lachnospiraceae bacterium]|nr:hypothetical protein [Lachnospiraceae bacterium]
MKEITKGIRQILFKNKKVKRQIALFMVLCMLFTIAQVPGMDYAVKADNSALNSTVSLVTLNGVELTDGMTVTDGSVLKINFDWALDNGDRSTTEFTVDLNPLQNITIAPSAQMPLMDAGKQVGYYQVVDGGVLKIVITDNDFLMKDGREGGVEIEGTVQVNDDQLADESPVTVGFGTKTYELVYSTGVNETWVNFGKSANGNVYKVGDDFKQKYNIYVYATDIMTDLTFTDTHGSGLGAPEEIRISSSNCAALPVDTTFDSISALNAYLAGKQINGNESFTIDYVQAVDHASDDIDNTASLTYTSNKGKEHTLTSSAKANVKDPSISKTGVREGDTAKWTIRVDLGDFKDGVDNLADVVQSIKDTLGTGLVGAGGEVDLALGSFDEVSDGVFEYVYETAIDPAYLNSPSAVTLTNKVDLVMKDGTTDSATGSIGIAPSDWVEKEATDYDSVNKIITWTVTLDVPDGVTGVTISDSPYGSWVSNAGNHSLVGWDVTIDSKKVIELGSDGFGALTSDGEDIVESFDKWNKAQAIKLKDDYVNSKGGAPITVIFRTHVDDDSVTGKSYANTVNVSYEDPQFGPQSTSAEGRYVNTSDLITKTGEDISGENAILYRVRAYLYGMTLQAGKDIVITEDFPDGLTLRDGSVKAVIDNAWYGEIKTCSVNVVGETFTVQLTQDIIDAISKDYPYLTLSYILEMPEADEGGFAMQGPETFTNTASGTYDGAPIGNASCDVTMEPEQIVYKTGNYNPNTAPYVEYEVQINEDRLNLLPGAGDTLTATDTLGSALSYDISSIVVEKYNFGAYTWEPLTECRYTYNDQTNSLIFTKLPDETWIRIRYKARVNVAYNERLEGEEATNSFSLDGTTSEAVSAEKGFSVVAIKPSGWATSQEGQIELYKFKTEDGQMSYLNGAVFQLRRVKYNESTGQMVDDIGLETDVDYNGGNPVIKTGITVSENGLVTIGGLSYARIYALEETQAPTGYAKRTEPYYFVLAGTSAALPPESSGIKVNVFSSGAKLMYENHANTKGSLTVTKTLEGVDAADVASVLSTLTFEVKKDGVTIAGGSFSGSELTYSGGSYKKIFSDLDDGTYTVTETMTDADGYVYRTSEYQITVDEISETPASYTAGDAASRTMTGAQALEFAFTNTYEKTAALKLNKAVTGDADWDAIKDSITFTVYDDSTMTSVVKTFTGSDFAADGDSYTVTLEGLDPAKTYYVKETGADLANYERVTTYTIAGGAAQDGDATTAGAALVSGEATEVSFVNDYTMDKGKLKLAKTFSHIKRDDETEKTWDDIAPTLTFTVTDKATGKQVAVVAGSQLTDEDDDEVYEYLLPIDLPVGEYVVTETVSDISGVVVVTSYVVTESGTPGASTVGTEATAEVKKDETTEVAYDNDYTSKYATLVIKKTVTGAREWADIRDDINFVVEYPTEPMEIISGSAPGWEQDGENTYVYKIIEITDEGDVKVTETFTSEDTNNYTRTTTVKVDNGASQNSEEASFWFDVPQGATVHFDNDYSRNTGMIVLEKTIAGVADDELDAVKNAVEFTVTPSPDGIGASKTYKLSEFKKASDGKYTLTISGVPTGAYNVKETAYDAAGYDTKSVTYVVDGGEVTNGRATGADVTVTTNDSEKVSVTDTYEKHKGSIRLSKSVTGARTWENVKDKISFHVTGDGYDETFGADDFTLTGGVYVCNIPNLPLGEYTVTEILEDTQGYSATTTYKVDSGAVKSGKSADVTIAAKNQLVSVEYVNDYKDLSGTILLKKSVVGDRSWNDVKDTLYFFLMQGNTEIKSIPATEFSGPDADGNYYYEITGMLAGTYTIKEVVSGENTISYTRMTTVKVGDGQATVGVSGKIELGATEGAEAVIVNSYTRHKGSLQLKKTISGIKTGDVENAKSQIAFTVSPSPDGNGSSKTYKLSEFTKNADGTYSLNLTNVPTGTYTVKETAYNVNNYNTTGVSYQVTTASGAVQNPANGQANGATVAVGKGATTTVAVTDTYTAQVGNLKLVKGCVGAATEKALKDITYVIVGPNGYSKTIKGTELTLDTGVTGASDAYYSYEITGLALGNYTITETAADGTGYRYLYTVSNGTSSGVNTSGATTLGIAVKNGTTATATYHNYYEKIKTGDIVITKTLAGNITGEDAKAALRFKVTNKDTGISQELTLKDFVYDSATGKYTKTLEANVGGYTVEESVYDVDGYTTLAVEYTVDGGAAQAVDLATEKPATDVEVTDGGIVTVDFKDSYEKKVGNLVLAKTVKGDLGWDAVKDKLSFVVKNNKTGAETTYQAATFKDGDGDGVYTLLIEGLPIGNYTVTEKLDGADGYTVKTTYAVDGGKTASGTEAKFELVKAGNRVDFVNEYTDTKGKLVITKKLRGNIDRKDAQKVIKFKVTNVKTKKSKTYKLKEFTYDKETKKYTLTLSVEPGTYKVTETAYDVDGYKTVSVSYTIGDGDKKNGTSAKVKVETGDTVKVAFVDKYSKTKISGGNDTSTTTTTTSSSSTSTTGRDTPKTGDDFPLALWLGLLMLGALGLSGSVYGIRKNSK